MSDNGNFGFAKLVPGFDFLQNLTKGAAQNLPQVPGLSNWVAPTLNVEELEKRITELKAVHYWLEQNGKALGATIQALEVQKMTLATLQGMNVKMGEVADALKLKPASSDDKKDKAKPAGAAAVDPLQWWGALTQQFQEIATNAMKDATQKTAVEAARTMATGVAKEAMKAASGMAKAATAPAKKTPARKSAARKAAAAPRKTGSRS
jgi:hypothetical protein